MLHRTANFAMVLCLGLVILAWGTSPCLFASMLTGDGCGADLESCGCGCCCEEEPQAPVSGTDECPTCSSIGNMHELVPVGAKVALDTPSISAIAIVAPVADGIEVSDASAHMTPLVLEPPRVHFCATVALLR